MEGRWYVVYTSSGVSEGSGRDAVGYNLHLPHTGDGVTVGVTTSDV